MIKIIIFLDIKNLNSDHFNQKKLSIFSYFSVYLYNYYNYNPNLNFLN